MVEPIVDIHCDLLSFLAEKEGRHVEDKASRCSYPDLIKGGVHLQTLAIFSRTKRHSIDIGKRQVEQFVRLVETDPVRFHRFSPKLEPTPLTIIAAFENASAFAEEGEPVKEVIERLESYIQLLGPLFYISLTWDTENRFGGGSQTDRGLKEDGRHLLDYLSGKRIAIDLSHASDRLAYELIEWIDKKALTIPIIASHSNFRSLADQPRNLPDDLAKEIIRRKGLIGLNFFAPFVHEKDPSALVRHAKYGLSLSGQESLCFGADFFFYDQLVLPLLRKKYQRDLLFFDALADASTYPCVLEWFKTKGNFAPAQITKIASQNALSFLNRTLF